MPNKAVVSVIHQGETTEIQWGVEEPAEGRIQGYVQIVDGALYVPFRDMFDEPLVFMLNGKEAAVFHSEDVPPSPSTRRAWSVLQ